MLGQITCNITEDGICSAVKMHSLRKQ